MPIIVSVLGESDMYKSIAVVLITLIAVASGAAYAGVFNTRSPVAFYKGHTHDHGQTQGAPQHSGGTDRNGCHNASVPYHCH